jgi:hypothetical protein
MVFEIRHYAIRPFGFFGENGRCFHPIFQVGGGEMPDAPARAEQVVGAALFDGHGVVYPDVGGLRWGLGHQGQGEDGYGYRINGLHFMVDNRLIIS